jgi:hypothetical protein
MSWFVRKKAFTNYSSEYFVFCQSKNQNINNNSKKKMSCDFSDIFFSFHKLRKNKKVKTKSDVTKKSKKSKRTKVKGVCQYLHPSLASKRCCISLIVISLRFSSVPTESNRWRVSRRSLSEKIHMKTTIVLKQNDSDSLL